MPAPFSSRIPSLGLTAIIDILVVAFLIYQAFMLIKGRRSAQLVAGIAVAVLIYAAAVWLRLQLLRTIIAAIIPYSAFAVIVLFQPEIRRALIRLGRRGWLGFGGRLQRLESADEILLALGRLSQSKTGALIVIERDTGLRTFIESGVLLNAHLSRDLLLSIFQPGGALHDGAVIVQKDRIAAAACFLPLSMNPALSRKLGTRHRAAIGITEEADCLALVVSEETGWISVAASGEIEQNVTLRRVDELISRHFGRRVPRVAVAEEMPGEAPLDSKEAGWREARRG